MHLFMLILLYYIKDKNFAFDIAKIAEKATYRYTDTNPNTKSEANLKLRYLC